MRVNPVRQVLTAKRPFVVFHTHVIDRQVMDAAVAAGKSLEVDISIDDTGKIYVGHPLSHYAAVGLPPPDNLPLDVVVAEAKAAGLFLVLDCKDVRVLPKAEEIIKAYGAENCLYHSWSDALILEPYLEPVEESQPNWADEELPHAEILKLRQATGVPMVLSCHRGLTRRQLESNGQAIADRIAEIVDGNAEGVSFAMPTGQGAPRTVMEQLLAHNILPTLHLADVLAEDRPEVYLAWSDNLEQASDPADFA